MSLEYKTLPEHALELLHSLDRMILDPEPSVEDSVSIICMKIEAALSVQCTAYAIFGGKCLPFVEITSDSADALAQSVPPPQILKNVKEQSAFVKCGPNEKIVYLYSKASPHLAVLMAVRERLPEHQPSRFGNEGYLKFFQALASQISIVLACGERSAFARMKEMLIEDLFENQLQPTRCWKVIADHVTTFLPNGGPLAVPPPLLVQLFTSKIRDRFLVLRAYQSKGEATSFRHVTVSTTEMALRLDDTIVGLAVERDVDYVLMNPNKEARDRYVTFFSRGRIPESELVVPVRYGGELVGVINLEHPEPDAFNEYHCKMLQSVALFIGPLVYALVSRENRLRSKETVSLYVMTKLLHRMASTYRHKTANLLVRSRVAANNLRQDVEQLGSPATDRAYSLLQFLDEFAERSKAFLSELPYYVRYGATNLSQTIQEAVNEFDPSRLSVKGRIDIHFARPLDPGPTVYASPMLREHVYNIINNSIDAILGAMDKDNIDRGIVSISVEETRLRNSDSGDIWPSLIRVRISDNGGGVPSNVFGNLMRKGFTTKRQHGGSGFGLPAAQEYLESIGGRLVLDNHEGIGLTVTMYLQEYTAEYHDQLHEIEA